MARYIDADKLMQKLSRMIDYCKTDSKINGLTALFQVGDAIMDSPAADVIREVHGHWKSRGGKYAIICSVCAEPYFFVDTSKYDYCPCCGAKMDGKDD